MPGTRAVAFVSGLLASATLLASIASASYAQGPASDCDEVSIDSAGVYAIKRSKIAGLAVTRQLGGVVDYVSIWPLAADGDQQNGIVRIIVMPDLKLLSAPDCKVVPGFPGDSSNAVTCGQSLPDLNLRVIVRFDAAVLPPYQARMKSVIDYLTTDVFGCTLPEKTPGRRY
jgi:hypothetical protein